MAKKKVFDRNILIIVGFVVLLALAFIIFRLVTTKKCPEVKFQIVEQNPTEKTPINFVDQTEGATRWEWDFGDSTEHVFSQTATHTYATAREYIVTLKVNGSCAQTQHLIVTSQYIQVDTTLPVGNISGPATVTLGKAATFKDISNNAQSWEWDFGESGTIDATTKEATYTFQKAGMHTVQLIINNNGKSVSAKVNVIYVNPEAVAGIKNKNQISEEDFIAMMNSLHNPQNSYRIFEKYVGNLNMPVTINGTRKVVFSSYCRGFSMDQQYMVKTVKLTKDKNGYITDIDITEQKQNH